MMTVSDSVDIGDLPEYIRAASRPAHFKEILPANMGSSGNGGDVLSSLEEHERVLILQALEQTGSNQSQAARMLRIGRDALRYKMKKYAILN